MMNADKQIEWLFKNSAPILRYRLAVEWMGTSGREREHLLQDSLATPEVQRWLSNLKNARAIHGSTDLHAENALAKLLQYGYDRNVPAFAESAQHLLVRPLQMWDALALMPFLLRAGYEDHPWVRDWYIERIEKLYQTACRGSYDFFLEPEQAGGVPKAWRGKPIYRDEFGHLSGYPLPTCYDFYGMAYCPPSLPIENSAQKLETIASFLGDQRFQGIVDGYGWDKEKRRCYAAGRVFLACVTPARLVLFLELGSSSKSARHSAWFREGLLTLESCRTGQGTYRFPPSMLKETMGNHIYGGSHMGMGEDRRSRLGLELESMYWMLLIRKNMQTKDDLAGEEN